MQRSSRVLAVVIALGMLFALAACAAPANNTGGNSTGGASGGSTITLQNLSFNPTSLTVKTGATVTFKNADQVPHHIVVGTDDLGEQAPGQDKTWTAPKDGVYNMRCVIHPQMQGQITVGAGGSTVGTTGPGGSTGGNSTGGGSGFGY